jgi:hypothetical protein
MFDKIITVLKRKRAQMLFNSGRTAIRVTGINAFSPMSRRVSGPPVVRLTFIAGPNDFVAYYVALRDKYSDEILNEIASDEVALRANEVVVTVGLKGGSAKNQVPAGEISKERVAVLLIGASCQALIFGGYVKVGNMIFKKMFRRPTKK